MYFLYIFINKKLTPKSAAPLPHFMSGPFTLKNRCYVFDTQCQNIRIVEITRKKILFALYDDIMCYLCLSPPLAAPCSDSYTGPCPRVERTPPPWTADAYSYRTQNRPSGRRSPGPASPSPSTG